MRIGMPRETESFETRVAITPATAQRLVQKGHTVNIESRAGKSIQATDEDYKNAGADIMDRQDILTSSDVILRVLPPPPEEIPVMKRDAVHISFLDPFQRLDLIKLFREHNITAVSMEMIPRSTIAQKMDALSSQANLAGYVAVITAAERLNKILPMMMTPAGTIAPCRVFVIGAGVAGLQAIATAKRLGARVDAFDTRPVVEEQVASLGAKFIKIDLGETGQTKDGYAKKLTDEQLAQQRAAMAKICAQSDIVITTAQIFGKKAPLIITKDMIQDMKPGSVIVDLAVESGGNVEGSCIGEEIELNQVRIIGLRNLPGRVSVHASQMYAQNLTNFIETFWDEQEKTFRLDLSDDICQSAVVTHQGQIVQERIKALTT